MNPLANPQGGSIQFSGVSPLDSQLRVNGQPDTPKSQEATSQASSASKSFQLFSLTFMQNTIDNKAGELEAFVYNRFQDLKAMAGWNTFNAFMTEKIGKSWSLQVISAILKMPVDSAKKFIIQFYQLVKAVLRAIVHPVEGVEKLAKALVALIYALATPETWTLIGAGALGANIGTALMGNPIAQIATTAAIAAMAAGLTVGALRDAVIVYRRSEGGAAVVCNAILDSLKKQVDNIPQAICDGLVMALMMGAIQKGIKAYDAKYGAMEKTKIINEFEKYDPTKWNSPKEYIDAYIQQRGLSKDYTRYVYDSGRLGSVHFYYENPEHIMSMQSHPKIAEIVKKCVDGAEQHGYKPITIEVVLGVDARVAIHAHRFAWGRWGYDVGAFNPTKLFTVLPFHPQTWLTRFIPIIERLKPVAGGVFAAT